MRCFVRKIKRSKWKPVSFYSNERGIDTLNADFLSTCLRTSLGCISLWEITNDDDIYNVAVELTIPGDRFDDLDFIILTENDLQGIGLLPHKKPEGHTPYRENHHELSGLNIKKINEISELIYTRINETGRCKRVTAPEAKASLEKQLNGGLKLPQELNILKKIG